MTGLIYSWGRKTDPHKWIDDMSESTEVLHFLPLHRGDEVTHQHHVAEAGSIQVPAQDVPKHLDGLWKKKKTCKRIEKKNILKSFLVRFAFFNFWVFPPFISLS